MTQATILTGAERRRRWSAGEKARLVEESLAPGSTVAEVARRHDIHANLLHLWRRQAREGVLPVEAEDTARLVPVALAAGNEASAGTTHCRGSAPLVEVVLRNGRLLRLPAGVAPARAAALADALDEPTR
jgi:transposase